METTGKRKIVSFVLKTGLSQNNVESDEQSLPSRKKIFKTKSLKERVETMTVDEFFNLLHVDISLKLIEGTFNPAKRWISFTWGYNTFEENLVVFEANVQIDNIRVTCRFTAKMWKQTSGSRDERYFVRICPKDGNFIVDNKKEKYGKQYDKYVRVQDIQFVSEEVVSLPNLPPAEVLIHPVEQQKDCSEQSSNFSLRRELIEFFLRDEDTLRDEMTKVVKEKYSMKIEEMIEAKIRKEIEDTVKKDTMERWTTEESLINKVKEEAKTELKKREDFQKKVEEETRTELKNDLLNHKKHQDFRDRVVLTVVEEYKKRDAYKPYIKPKLIEEIKRDAQFRSDFRKEMELEEKTVLLEQKMKSVQKSIQKDPRRAEKTIMGPIISSELELLADVMEREGC